MERGSIPGAACSNVSRSVSDSCPDLKHAPGTFHRDRILLSSDGRLAISDRLKENDGAVTRVDVSILLRTTNENGFFIHRETLQWQLLGYIVQTRIYGGTAGPDAPGEITPGAAGVFGADIRREVTQ